MRFKRRQLGITPPYVSMADIAFNLVLFFVILAKTQDDSHIVWEPADAPGAKPAPISRVSISVDKDNRVYFNGKEAGVRDLAPLVEKELANLAQKDRAVLLKIHKETLAATFEPILEAVSQAGGEVVHVIEDEKK